MEAVARQLNPGEINLLNQAARALLRKGLARRRRENGLQMGRRWGTRVVSYGCITGRTKPYVFKLPNLPYPRWLSEEELERRFRSEPFRIGVRAAEKAGWVHLTRADLWITPWNLELALQEAKIEHDLRVAEVDRVLEDVIGSWNVSRVPTLILDHLEEKALWLPKTQRFTSIRCELMGLFEGREIEGYEWGQENLQTLVAWWQSVQWTVKGRPTPPPKDKILRRRRVVPETTIQADGQGGQGGQETV